MTPPENAALPRPTMPGGVPDHYLALHALNVLRAELRNMTFRTVDGQHNNLEVSGQSLDMVESIIKHHAAAQYRDAVRRGR